MAVPKQILYPFFIRLRPGRKKWITVVSVTTKNKNKLMAQKN